jgi:hypothetical protein
LVEKLGVEKWGAEEGWGLFWQVRPFEGVDLGVAMLFIYSCHDSF